MLLKPPTCAGCTLHTEGLGFMQPDGFPHLGVVLMGEALGEEEAKLGVPFKGRAGFRFGTMIERAGFTRDQFQVINAVWCQPPKNREPFTGEIDKCRQYWEYLLNAPECKVVMPMGNVPLFATTGKEGILSKRGYVEWSEKYQCWVLPTVHPSFIMRGNSNWEAAWLYDLRHAVEVAREGWTPVERDYLLDPSPSLAWAWARFFAGVLVQHPTVALSYDLETPDKSTAEDEVDINLGYLAGPIYRIGFAYVDPRTGKTHCLSVPWDASYREVIAFLLGLPCPKVVCYRHFDNPRIAAHGVVIEGEKHDMQEMWHVLHSNLPKNLEHVAPFLVPGQAAWKHLNEGETKAYYNAVDAGVEVECYYRLRDLLQQHGMWNVYWEDCFELNPILLYMSAQGMPIDGERRKQAAYALGQLKEAVRVKLNDAAEGARPHKIYTRQQEGLQEIAIEAEERYCSDCGKTKVNKKHPCFKVGEAPGEVPLGVSVVRVVAAKGWVKPLDFKPSQKGLLRYVGFKGYKVQTRYDRKSGKRVASMDENSVRQYALTYPEDPIFALVLEERELGKLLGTYTGKLTLDPPKPRTGNDEWWEAWRTAQFRDSPVEKDRIPRHHAQTETPTTSAADDDIPF